MFRPKAQRHAALTRPGIYGKVKESKRWNMSVQWHKARESQCQCTIAPEAVKHPVRLPIRKLAWTAGGDCIGPFAAVYALDILWSRGANCVPNRPVTTIFSASHGRNSTMPPMSVCFKVHSVFW